MAQTYSEADVLGWKISRVVAEAHRLNIGDNDIAKLKEEEVNGPTLISLIIHGRLETVVSPDASKALVSLIHFPADRQTLQDELAEVQKQLAASKLQEEELQKQLMAFSYIDVWGACSHSSKSSTSRTRDENMQFRNSLVKYYELSHEKCMVTGESGKLKAAHIWPWAQSKHPSLGKLRIEEPDIDSPRNGLLLLTTIELAFDRKDICFLYDPFNVKFLVNILNPSLKTQQYVDGKCFGDLAGTFLNLPDGKFPFRRLLNTHARASYRNALLAGWISRDTLQAFEDYAHLSDVATDGPIDEEDSLASVSG